MPFLYLSGRLWETEPAQELASAETFAFASTRSGLKITAARISPLFPAVCRHCGVRPDRRPNLIALVSHTCYLSHLQTESALPVSQLRYHCPSEQLSCFWRAIDEGYLLGCGRGGHRVHAPRGIRRQTLPARLRAEPGPPERGRP